MKFATTKHARLVTVIVLPFICIALAFIGYQTLFSSFATYDDEGYPDGSGDGGFDYDDATNEVEDGDEVFVRISLTVGEPWNPAYLDPTSLAYKQMARRLKSALSGFYSNVNGVQSVNVVKFQ